MISAKAIVDVAGLELTPEDKQFLSHPCIAGVILFARNYESKTQLRALTQSIHDINPNFIICVDQEGGRVQRFRDEFTPLKAMHTFGEQYLVDPSQAQEALRAQLVTMINELKEVGVTATLIPVVDLDYGRSEIIGERSFGHNPKVVTALAEQVIDTLHEFDMPATIKHFPGHGFVVADSHLDLPIDDRPFETIKNNDMAPFMNLLHKADYIMPAHIIFSAVDTYPVGFSSKWLKAILRDQLGYQGKIMTDDLSMQGAAQFGDYSARARAAIDAGCDFLLVCNDRNGAIEVVGTLECQMPHFSPLDKSLNSV
jgi:beta-N-acetylhexosaminidase